MDLSKKIKELEVQYAEKAANMQQMEAYTDKLRREAINLEGQIFALTELQKENPIEEMPKQEEPKKEDDTKAGTKQ